MIGAFDVIGPSGMQVCVEKVEPGGALLSSITLQPLSVFICTIEASWVKVGEVKGEEESLARYERASIKFNHKQTRQNQRRTEERVEEIIKQQVK